MEGTGRHESCPLPKTHARLRQAHALWHMAADSYGEPEGFTIHLNATLQALRTVTWVLRKESKRHPGFQDFEAWYARHQADLKADPLLSWAVNARNEVEHEGDLERASHTIVRVLRDYDEKVVLESEAPALARTDAIAAALASRSCFPSGSAAQHCWRSSGAGALRSCPAESSSTSSPTATGCWRR